MIDVDVNTRNAAATSAPARYAGDTSLRERVVSGVMWLTATRASGQLISWIITIFVVRVLSPEDYGLMGMAIFFTGLLFLLNELGLGTAIVQRAELSPSQLSNLRWLILLINAAIFVLLQVVAPAVAAYFNEPRLTNIIRVLAITFLINGFGVPSASILQREMAFKEKASAEVAGNLAGGVATLALALNGWGVWSLVGGNLLLRFVTTALYCVYRPPTFQRFRSADNLGLFVQFGFQVAVSRILWYFSATADVAIVGKVLGSVQLGYYSLAFQYASLPLEKFVTILNEIAFPSFSSVQADTKTLQRHFLRLVHFVALVTFPIFIGLSLVAHSAVEVLLGAKWLPIVLPLQLLCVVSCFRAIETINMPVTLARGRPRVAVYNTLLTAILLPPSFYIGARQGGIMGVAIAWLLVRPLVFAAVTSRTLTVVELGVARYARCLLHPTLGSLAMTAVVVMMGNLLTGAAPTIRLMACSLAGCSIYFLYQVVFDSAALQELREIFARRNLSPRRDSIGTTVQPVEHRRILLAAYHFPPSAAVGGLRMTRFARFLPDFGWRPFVLTVDDADRWREQGTDHSRLVGLETLPITRTRKPSGLLDLYSRVRRSIRRRWPARTVQPALAVVASGKNGTGRETFAQRLKRYATSLIVMLPDEEKSWALSAALPAVRLIRRQRIEYILTSAPPFSVHVIGLAAKWFTRARWVADFRDPWLELIFDRPANAQSDLARRLEARMEALVMRHADKVLVTTERMRASILTRYPQLPPDKFACLPNGIDVSRVTESACPEKYEQFTITYAGTLYLDRTPEPLFEALGMLVTEGKVRLDDVRIKLVGSCRYIGEVETQDVARRHGVEASVEIIERVPHAEAIRIMQRSHLLLVLAPPNHHLVQPAKIFDYLGSGSRLLALTDAGATADLIHETRSGTCFSQHDIDSLKTYLHGLLTAGAYRNLRNDPDAFRRYDARALTSRLVAELAGEQVGSNPALAARA